MVGRQDSLSHEKKDVSHAHPNSLHERACGVLLHPTSLPSPYGIGDLGPTAHRWVEDLAGAGQTWWQILPLGPSGYGDSPYQSPSSFAGNTNLISPEALHEAGLLTDRDLENNQILGDQVDSEQAHRLKDRLLRRAFTALNSVAHCKLREQFHEFCRHEARWLSDYALFMAVKAAHGGGYWLEWPEPLVRREHEALATARTQLAAEIEFFQFGQFIFERQWRALRRHAHAHKIRIIGDVPIFVSGDSADVWADPQFFALDTDFHPAFVAGVPPDYFCETGQLWGNPVYDWSALKAAKYEWWVARLKKTLERVDLVRLDHFRGFEAYWEVPADHPTAERGRWVMAPGHELLGAIERSLGKLPLIAEDLGVITPEVDALRHEFKLPGMCVLQFAFGGAQEDRFIPHNVRRNTVIYTGTHDNDTSHGWYASELNDAEREYFWSYAPSDDRDPAWNLIRLAWASVAHLAITPFQDVLGLGTEARLNRPGNASGNWRWRIPANLDYAAKLARLAELTKVYQRDPRDKQRPVSVDTAVEAAASAVTRGK